MRNLTRKNRAVENGNYRLPQGLGQLEFNANTDELWNETSNMTAEKVIEKMFSNLMIIHTCTIPHKKNKNTVGRYLFIRNRFKMNLFTSFVGKSKLLQYSITTMGNLYYNKLGNFYITTPTSGLSGVVQSYSY